MRRTVAVAAAWLGAASAVTALSWRAVGVIGDRVAGVSPAPIRPSEVAGARPDAPEPTSTTTTAVLAPPSSGPVAPPEVPGPATTRPLSGPRPGPTTSTAPQPAPPPTSSGPSTTTTTAGATRTYTLVGGSAAVRFTPSGATLLWATPNPGFEAEVDQEGGRLKVEFESDTHRSELEAWWDGGPRDSVREERRDGHD